MPLSYIPHIPVIASPRCTFFGLYHGTNHIESAIQSHTHPLFVHTVQEQYLIRILVSFIPLGNMQSRHTLPRYKQTKITLVTKFSMDQFPVTISPSMVTSAYKNATSRISVICTEPGKSFTHSLPVQKLDASLANHATTPRSSSGRPMRPKGFKFDHFSRRWGCASRYAAVILSHGIIVVSVRTQKKK